MRGRYPQALSLASGDVPILQHMARSQSLPWHQVRRARTVLAVASGKRIRTVALHLDCGVTTVRRTCRCYQRLGLQGLLAPPVRAGRPVSFAPLQKAQIVKLACLEPVARGLHITHWSSHDLAREAVREEIVPAISSRTIRRILAEVDLQPHRTRYWKTGQLDETFKKRAEKVLWCYGHAESLAQEGIGVVCADEIPNLQILERKPIRRAIPGFIEQIEYEYTRHGTVNFLVFLMVVSGLLEINVLDHKNADHYIRSLRAFRRRHSRLKCVYLIHDGDPSHTAAETRLYLAGQRDWWKSRFTPPHASWLNQGEIGINMFKGRYLKRSSWKNREALIDQVLTGCPEYNRLYAHPVDWTWTNAKMRKWYAEHAHR